MARKTKKFNFVKLLFFILLIIYVINYLNNNHFFDEIKYFEINKESSYKTIKLDDNKNYSGIGQEKVSNKDGYFSTFTTYGKYKKTYIEYKQNGNSSWANKEYWGGTMSEKGCGVTVMSIILSGYGKDYTPDDLREKYYPVMNYENLSDELFKTFGIKNSDFYYDATHLSNDYIIEHLKTDRPIIVCVWDKPSDNRWTTASHYLALLATDENNMVYISNPNRWRK